MTQGDQQSLLATMADTATFVAAVTGIKAQFIESGWDPHNAELMVIELWRANNKPDAS